VLKGIEERTNKLLSPVNRKGGSEEIAERTNKMLLSPVNRKGASEEIEERVLEAALQSSRVLEKILGDRIDAAVATSLQQRDEGLSPARRRLVPRRPARPASVKYPMVTGGE
jgi:hypothetical protein